MENEGNVEGNNAVREKENKSDKAKFPTWQMLCFKCRKENAILKYKQRVIQELILSVENRAPCFIIGHFGIFISKSPSEVA